MGSMKKTGQSRARPVCGNQRGRRDAVQLENAPHKETTLGHRLSRFGRKGQLYRSGSQPPGSKSVLPARLYVLNRNSVRACGHGKPRDLQHFLASRTWVTSSQCHTEIVARDDEFGPRAAGMRLRRQGCGRDQYLGETGKQRHSDS